MKKFIINYDLIKTKDYLKLHEGIKKFDNWCHPLLSTWVIESEADAIAIRNYCQQFMDGDDKIIVVEAKGEIAWGNISGEASAWLSR